MERSDICSKERICLWLYCLASIVGPESQQQKTTKDSKHIATLLGLQRNRKHFISINGCYSQRCACLFERCYQLFCCSIDMAQKKTHTHTVLSLNKQILNGGTNEKKKGFIRFQHVFFSGWSQSLLMSSAMWPCCAKLSWKADSIKRHVLNCRIHRARRLVIFFFICTKHNFPNNIDEKEIRKCRVFLE